MSVEEIRKELEEKVGKTWTTDEMQKDFTVHGFGHGFCFVTRKSDNVEGSLDFTHMPRFYFGFCPSKVEQP